MLTQNKSKIYIPSDGIAGLKENFSKDALSGFLVFLLALPLSLGIAKASDFPPIFGLVSAIIGGLVVSFFSGSRLTIKGPAAGLIVIASGAVASFGGGEMGWQLALAAIVVAGLVQIIFGIFKLGSLADFFPSAAIHGMLAAIGIIIMSKQIHSLLGIDPKFLKGKEPLELLMMIPDSIIHENAHIAEIGIACILILIGMSFVKHNKLKKIPAPLIVLAVAIPIGMTLHIKTDGQIAAFSLVKIGSIFDSFKNGLINANFSGLYSNVGLFIQYVILFSLIGTLESLLTAKAIDGLDPFKRKSNFNKDVIAVGIGNVISGLLGGLPMISEVARSSANVANGARTRWANFFHGLFLLIAVLFAVPFIELIPNSALAAMLTFVGFKLAHPKEFIHMWHIGKEQFLIFTATVITTLATDLLIGVGTGILLEIIVNIYNGCSLKMLFSSNLTLTNQDEDNYRLTINSDLVFSNILGFKKVFLTIPSGKNIIIDMTKAKIVDHTSIITLNSLIHDYKHAHGKINLIGFENHRQLSHATTSTRILKRN